MKVSAHNNNTSHLHGARTRGKSGYRVPWCALGLGPPKPSSALCRPAWTPHFQPALHCSPQLCLFKRLLDAPYMGTEQEGQCLQGDGRQRVARQAGGCGVDRARLTWGLFWEAEVRRTNHCVSEQGRHTHTARGLKAGRQKLLSSQWVHKGERRGWDRGKHSTLQDGLIYLGRVSCERLKLALNS